MQADALHPSLLARVRRAPVTALLAAACLGAFAWLQAQGGSTDPVTLLRWGALAREPVWFEGQGWRLLTATFLHAGFIHLACNLGFGLPWCALLERGIGHGRFAALWLACAVAGSALSLLGGRADVSVGASGALFGVIGAVLGMQRRHAGGWRPFLAHRGVRAVLVNLLLLGVAGLWLPIDNLAHLGGLVTGAAAGWLLAGPPRAWGWGGLAAGWLAATALALHPPAALRAEAARAHGEIRPAPGAGRGRAPRRRPGARAGGRGHGPGARPGRGGARLGRRHGELRRGALRERPGAVRPRPVRRGPARLDPAPRRPAGLARHRHPPAGRALRRARPGGLLGRRAGTRAGRPARGAGQPPSALRTSRFRRRPSNS
ncbi:MAG: rhomboid family intramembrane serine protease [Anaeromyxobacter sp.]